MNLDRGMAIRAGLRPANATNAGSRYAIWVTNINRTDNEDVIVRVPLNKGM